VRAGGQRRGDRPPRAADRGAVGQDAVAPAGEPRGVGEETVETGEDHRVASDAAAGVETDRVRAAGPSPPTPLPSPRPPPSPGEGRKAKVRAEGSLLVSLFSRWGGVGGDGRRGPG